MYITNIRNTAQFPGFNTTVRYSSTMEDKPMVDASAAIDLSNLQSQHADADRIGVASTKGVLWEIGQYLADRFQAVKDADGLRVRISEDRWAFVWVADTSGRRWRGYTYALMCGTSETEHGFTDNERRILESDADAWFQPGDVVQAVQDALNEAVNEAAHVPA